MDRVDAEWPRRLGIGGDVVDKDRALRVDAVALYQQPVDRRVGLDDAVLTRDDAAVEP